MQDQSLQFLCPACGGRLRIRAVRADPFPCPDCAAFLLLTIDEAGEVHARRTVEQPAPSDGVPPTRTPVAPDAGGPLIDPAFVARPATPYVAVAASLSLAAIVTAALFLVRPGMNRAGKSPAEAPAAAAAQPGEENGTEREAGQAASESFADRAQRIGQAVFATATETAEYPTAERLQPPLPAGARFSWLAVLPLPGLHDLPAHWEFAWNDPRNDRFVRRSRSEFLNPMLPDLTGSDGYPATHLAGVTGIGPDAATLPAGHPRAGVLGTGRATRLADLADGQSQTLLAMGVARELGSWASGGRPTARALTTEPYLHGPDGFGGAPGAGVVALMADGRVQELSPETNADVLRRLAVVRKPDTKPAAGPAFAANGGGVGTESNDPPLLPEFAPEPHAPPLAAEPAETPIDLRARLQQKLLRFELSQPVALDLLLEQFEEMVGAPIDRSRLDAAILAGRVTVKRERVTLEELLDAVLQERQLTWRIDSARLVVEPKP